jgi:KDO2-lipid IV(A) lauroyltransferase
MLQWISATIALFIIWLMSWLPLPLIRLLGRALGWLGFYVARERRNVGLKNLSLCFPKMSEQEKKYIIYKHFQYLVTAALEYGLVFYASRKRIQQLVKVKNVQYLLEHYEKRPIILLCPHFVGLDLGAIRLSTEFVGFSLYSQQKNSLITDKLKQARLRFIKDKGAEIFARQEGLRPIIRKLRQTKQLFYYLPDQDFGERDSVFVPFFAYPHCATIHVLPKLVQMMDAVVIPMAVYKVDDHYEVEFWPAWQNYPTNNLDQDVIRMNQFIESAVLKALPQYFWLHKRFKTQPAGPRGELYKDC